MGGGLALLLLAGSPSEGSARAGLPLLLPPLLALRRLRGLFLLSCTATADATAAAVVGLGVRSLLLVPLAAAVAVAVSDVVAPLAELPLIV